MVIDQALSVPVRRGQKATLLFLSDMTPGPADCERVSKADLIGVGMNVNLQPRDVPPALRKQITSLAQIGGRAIDLTDALIVLSRHLHAAMSRRGDRCVTETRARYDRHHALIDRQVSVIEAGSGRLIHGRCIGLDSAGRLLLRDGRQTHTVLAGQVRMH